MPAINKKETDTVTVFIVLGIIIAVLILVFGHSSGVDYPDAPGTILLPLI